MTPREKETAAVALALLEAEEERRATAMREAWIDFEGLTGKLQAEPFFRTYSRHYGRDGMRRRYFEE